MIGGNGKSSNSSTLPFLSQIAEEDLTSGSTSVASFHIPNPNSRHHPPQLPSNRTLSDQDLFVPVNNDARQDFLSTTTKPVSYSHFNFEQSSKQQLTKGNSLASMSSDSVDVSINNGETATRRKVHTTSPPNDLASESPLYLQNGNKSKVKLRKQTQNIAARAAQRRANLHHKEVVEDMGKNNCDIEFFGNFYTPRFGVFFGTD
jgi:hypothetical protein